MRTRKRRRMAIDERNPVERVREVVGRLVARYYPSGAVASPHTRFDLIHGIV